MENKQVLEYYIPSDTDLYLGYECYEFMEQYANYKNRVLEDRIKEFRKELNLWWLFDADGKKITKDLLNEYDRHFNLK